MTATLIVLALIHCSAAAPLLQSLHHEKYSNRPVFAAEQNAALLLIKDNVAGKMPVCAPPARPVTRHNGDKVCVCPPEYPQCRDVDLGAGCLHGHYLHKDASINVQGYRYGCTLCSCAKASPWSSSTASGSSSVRERGGGEGGVPHVAATISTSAASVSIRHYIEEHGMKKEKQSSAPILLGRHLPPRGPIAFAASASPKVVFLTVATHREPFIDLLENSIERLGSNLIVSGIGGHFTGYGWKLRQALAAIRKHAAPRDLVVFTDSFDSYVFANEDEIARKFMEFEGGPPMIVSGEVNLWPDPKLADELPPAQQPYPYPNSGGYIGRADYLEYVLAKVVLIEHKSDCCDDQGELIRALAFNHSVFTVDYEANIFQTLFGRARKDVSASGGRVANHATGTYPCIVHANGWDKAPLLDLLHATDRLSREEYDRANVERAAHAKRRTLQARERSVNDRCTGHNPNAVADIKYRPIHAAGVSMETQSGLRTLLEDQGRPWREVEQRIFEIQEYRVFCPVLPEPVKEKQVPPPPRQQHTMQSMSDVQGALIKKHITTSSNTKSSASDNKSFCVWVEPEKRRVGEEERGNGQTNSQVSLVYRAIRSAIEAGPYSVPRRDETCTVVPAVDTLCWCESCMDAGRVNILSGGSGGWTISSASKAITRGLTSSPGWNGGRNHLLFELSDAPCTPYEVGQAIVAKAGLSSFHYRPGHDISMPLFGMVDFSETQRRVPPSERPYLLTFRGTRSPGSDGMRRLLPRLHNGRDIVLACACRWYDVKGNGKEEGDEQQQSQSDASVRVEDSGYDESCTRDETIFAAYTYTELASRTKFALIVEGFGYHSFRLTEMMAAGAIPVIVVDHYRLPFDELLDWSDFSIRVPEHRFEQLPAILAAIKPERVIEMQRNVVRVYEQHFRSLGHQVHTALESLRIQQTLQPTARAAELIRIRKYGLPYNLTGSAAVTPQKVLDESLWCNTPEHRRKASRDGAPM